MADTSPLTSIARLTLRAAKFKRFALIFAICDSLEEQENKTIELQEFCDTQNVKLTELNLFHKEPIVNLKTEIQYHLQEKKIESTDIPLGIQVTGIDLSIVLDLDEKAPAVIQTLNMAREGFRDNLPYPIIIWLPEYAYAKIATIAPDFWSVRQGSYTFSTSETSSYILNKIESGDKNLTVWQDKISKIPVLERALILRDNLDLKNELFIKLGEAYYFIENYKKAQISFEKALETILTNEDPDQLEKKARALSKLSLIYSDYGQASKAIDTITQYIKITKSLEKPDLLAIGYNHMGLIHDRQKQYEKAIAAYEQALKINQAEGNLKSQGEVLGNMGLLYRKWDQKYEMSLKYHEQALNISLELSDDQGQAFEYGNIGLVHHQMKNYDMAIDFYERALTAHQRIGNRNGEINEFIHLGDVYRDQKNELKAKENYEEALTISREIGANLIRIYDRLAEMYGPEYFNDHDKAINYLEMLIKLCEDQENTGKQIQYWEQCCSIYSGNDVKINECCMKMKPLFKKQLAEGKDEIKCLEQLVHICEKLGKTEEDEDYEQRLNNISKYLTIWIRKSANVDVKDNIPVIRKGWAVHLDVSVGPYIKDCAWKYSIPLSGKINDNDALLDSSDTENYLEGRRISDSYTPPEETESLPENIEEQQEAIHEIIPEQTIPVKSSINQNNQPKRKSIWKYFSSKKRKKTVKVEKKSEQKEVIYQKILSPDQPKETDVKLDKKKQKLWKLSIKKYFPKKISSKIEKYIYLSEEEVKGDIQLTFKNKEAITISIPKVAIDIDSSSNKEVKGTVIIPRNTGKHELTIDCTIDKFSYKKQIQLPISILEDKDAPERSPDEPQHCDIWIEPVTKMRFVWIPGGCFMMGSPEDEAERSGREGPLHEVCVDGFWLGQYPVTQVEWEAIMGNNPSKFKSGPFYPVEMVSWNDTQDFINKLYKKTNQQFRLPTEAEWEYACRAGTQTPFYFGDNIGTDQVNYDGRYPYNNGKKGEYREKTTKVDSFPPNNFGLYDMHGNILEWVEDIFDGDYYEKSPKNNPLNINGSARVVRGGAWNDGAGLCRSASRGRFEPAGRGDDLGLRLALPRGQKLQEIRKDKK